MGNNTKIVLVIHSLQAGGMERVISILANEFVKKRDIDLHLILYGKKREIFYTIDKNIKIHKPQFEFNESKRLISTIQTIKFLRTKIKELQPDTVLSFGEYWNNLLLLATYGLPFPVYIADRSTPLKNLGKTQNFLRKQLYPKASGLILQTQKAKEIYQNEFKNLNISVIGNPIKEIKSKNNIEKENIVLTVGRLIDTKHHDRLIHIFSKIDNPNWKLILVGDDAKKQNNKERLTQLIKELNIEERVILAGKQKDVASYYLKSKIFAFTSSSEGFPNVIGEAMSAGLPVIAYDCMAGPSEIIKDGVDGFLIPLFDDEVFKDRLEFLMNNETKRKEMGGLAIKNIHRFDVNPISEKFLNIILSKK